jgi:O-antigen/teichoic acid export membrane protein
VTRPEWRPFVRNAIALTAAQAAAPALNVFLVAFMARRAGPETLGVYALLVAAFLVADQLRLFGLPRLLTREIAAGRPGALRLPQSVVAIADLGGVLAAGAFVFYGVSVGAPLVAVLTFAVGLAPSARVAVNDAIFLALGRADYTTRIVVFECSFRVSASLAILWLLGGHLGTLAAAWAAGRFVAAAVGAHYRRRLIGGAESVREWSQVRSLLSHIPSFFGVTALPLVLLRADLLVVGAVAGAQELGLYGAASRLATVLLVVPDGVMQAAFAQLSRARDAAARRHTAAALGAAALALLVPAAGVVAALAAPLAVLIYGPAFAGSGAYLMWLVWGLPLFVLCRTVGDALISAGHQRRLALAIVGTVIVSAPIYALLIARFGPRGAAMAYVASLVVLLIGSVVAARTLLLRAPQRRRGELTEAVGIR